MSSRSTPVFAVLAVIVIAIIASINHWIQSQVKPIETPVIPHRVVRSEPVVGETDPATQYTFNLVPPEPMEGKSLTDVLAEKNKKEERVRDEKIIYEMPTSNQFLVQ